MEKHTRLWCSLGVAVCLAGCATSPPPPVDVTQLVTDYYALRPTTTIGPDITMDEALRTQEALVEELADRAGSPVGYKVGLVTQESQKRYRMTAPVRGVLFSQMLLDNQARVPAKFGVAPLCEADLMVVVKDSGINRAVTVLEAARHLSEVVAFIELPDAFLSTNQPVTGAMLTAVNVGARLGVMGQRRLIQATPTFVDALASMQVTMTDQTGAVLGQAQGKAILDHPLHAVLWLSEELNRRGQKLRAGDLISLGGIHLITPQPDQSVTVTHDGLPGGPLQATVSFY